MPIIKDDPKFEFRTYDDSKDAAVNVRVVSNFSCHFNYKLKAINQSKKHAIKYYVNRKHLFITNFLLKK